MMCQKFHPESLYRLLTVWNKSFSFLAALFYLSPIYIHICTVILLGNSLKLEIFSTCKVGNVCQDSRAYDNFRVDLSFAITPSRALFDSISAVFVLDFLKPEGFLNTGNSL